MDIKTLTEDYKRRIDSINNLLEKETSTLVRYRLETKRGVFRTFISELQKCETNHTIFDTTNNEMAVCLKCDIILHEPYAIQNNQKVCLKCAGLAN